MEYKIKNLQQAIYERDISEPPPKMVQCSSCQNYFYSDDGEYIYSDFYCEYCSPKFRGVT